MRAAMGDGRFGPVFFADDVEVGRPVVIRVFERVDATVADALLDALNLLCSSPLDHPAIARPLACGRESGTGKALPFLVHSHLPGTSLDDFLAQHGPQPLDHVVARVAQVAASIDFAAAAGVHHGLLSARDIIVSDDNAGVTGFGLVQALGRSGIHVPGAAASHADDIHALAAIAFQLVTGTRYRGAFDQPLAAVPGADPTALRAALASALAIDAEVRPATALEFARALQDAVFVSEAVEPLAPAADVAGDIRLHLSLPDFEPVAEAEPANGGHRRLGDVNTPAVGPSDDVVMVRDHPSFVAAPRVSPAAVLVVVAVVVVAAVGGFAGGFTVAKRTVSTATAGDEPAAAPATSPQPRPEGTQGRTFTEASIDAASAAPVGQPAPATPPSTTTPPTTAASRRAVPPEIPRVEKPAATSSPSAPSPSAPSPSAPSAATADSSAATADRSAATADRSAATADRSAATADRPAMTVGSMEVLSRPAGAQVHVDGALVGQTPLTLPNVTPGNHVVRISLPGHQFWATSAVVQPGNRTRVAASLELVTDPQ